jgi:hypothetical protein
MPTEDASSAGPLRSMLPPGTRVEVRSGFDDSWQRGFTVDAVTDEGYVLRRESDDSLLPAIEPVRVRRQRSRQTWWV